MEVSLRLTAQAGGLQIVLARQRRASARGSISHREKRKRSPAIPHPLFLFFSARYLLNSAGGAPIVPLKRKTYQKKTKQTPLRPLWLNGRSPPHNITPQAHYNEK